MFGMIFILTLYMQQVLAYSPLETGLAWLATSLAALVASVGGSVLVTRIGPRVPMVVGLLGVRRRGAPARADPGERGDTSPTSCRAS